MIELTIKTLDAQNHHFTVPNDYTVEQLKEHIADTIQIPSNAQRCIYLGQVLQNDTKLFDCDVNGKVIHVVQRPPPSSAYAAAENPNPNANIGASHGRRPETHTGTMYLGAMAFPSDFVDANGGLTFFHSRPNLAVSRLAVTRNLLRRAVTLINQLENDNYFSSTQDQNNRSSRQTSNLTNDITNVDGGSGLDQPEVEIRIESPNSQHDNVSETIFGTDDSSTIQDTSGFNNGSTEQQPIDDLSNTENAPNSQPETENLSGNSSRDDANRRRAYRTPMMATVMGAVLHAQVRLIPFMRLLRQYLLQDTAFGSDSQTTHTEQQVQALYNSVSEIMHSFAHIYHSLSDITCDFGQPPPRRMLRCRPVVLQQQHATVLRSGSRGHIVRSPLLAVARNTSSESATNSADTSGNISFTGATAEAGPVESNNLNRDVATSSVEVVIEEADTTNMHDNNDEGIGMPENMDTSESVMTNGESNVASANANLGESTVTVRGRNGNTYVMQPMPPIPDGVVPEGIRINSVEATILTANEDIAAALTSGTNQRWRAGILPAEVLQNIVGLINQFRQSRQQRGSSSDRPRTQNSENVTDNNQSSNTSNSNDSSSQGQSNNSNERSFEFDISGLSRTFDPFLPCHSHHVHPVLRTNSSRSSTTRNTATQASSSNQSAQSQTQQNSSQSPQEQSTQESQSEEASAETHSQQPAGRNESETGFNLPDMPRNVTQFFNSMFPGFNIANVMIRRSSPDASNSTSDGDRSTHGRARVQLTSNLNAIFPGAIQIEIDPLTNNIQTNIVPNNNIESTERRPRSRRTRTGFRPRLNTISDPAAQVAYLASINEEGHLSMSSTSSSASTSSLSSSDEDIAENVGHEKKKAKKEKQNEFSPCKTIKNLYSVMQKETVRHLMGKKMKKEVGNNFPLYKENQEALFLEVINSVVGDTSFEQIITGSETNIEQLTSSIRQKIRSYLIEHRSITSCDQENLLDAVNVLINNDLYKMKYLLDSVSVKQEIDLVSTICKFNQCSVPELIEYIVKSEDLSEAELKKFCQTFYAYIAQLLTLFVHCISGDDKSVNIRKVLDSVMEEIIKGLPNDEDLVRWLRKDLINHVISYSKICHPDNLPSFMKHYVVYRLPPIMPIKCTVATAITNMSTETPNTAEQTQPMDVEESVQSSSSASSEASFVSLNSEEVHASNEQRTGNETADENSSILPVIPPAEALPEVVLNSEEWHRTFPSEWVPIIARDIHRLRRQGSEPPFSDAYLSGMPTKRRKLIKNNKPDVNSSEQLVNGNISSAIDSAGFSASLNTIANQVNETSTSPNENALSEIVKEELKENVRENIVQQTDFLPHRFPDSAKYFMEK